LPIQTVATSHQSLQKAGVCIFVHKDLYFSKINTSPNCKEKDLESCAFKLETKSSKLIILNLCRASTGVFNQFIKTLEGALKYLYKPKAEFLICGDINMSYNIESNKKNLVSLSTTYNLHCFFWAIPWCPNFMCWRFQNNLSVLS